MLLSCLHSPLKETTFVFRFYRSTKRAGDYFPAASLQQ
ncbi:hypothetical protein ASJ78_00638 [Serratia marcescens]|nr:hypothetical protein ASJ78_00638 [Serratia marcescens]CDJ75076.1 Hypothetical protein SMB2099_0462 [Serratia marcescens SMB2099]